MIGTGVQLVFATKNTSNATNITLVAIFAAGMALVVLVPFVLDIVNAHRSWRMIVTANPDKINDTLKQLPGPNGIQGLARATMALALIVAIAFGLGYVLVERPFVDNKTIASNILVALTTAFASITAFYFGGRTATEAQKGSAPSAGNGAPPADGADGAAPAPGVPAPARPAVPVPPPARVPLTVTITSPADGAAFTLGQVVNADYSATPSEGAAISVIQGPVEIGSPIDTSTAGDHQFLVQATDTAGNSGQATHSYTVTAV